MKAILGAVAAALFLGQLPAQAQLSIGGRNIQVHGFFSQGYANTDKNNYLTMKTKDGSFSMTDGGLNVSTQLTDNFRVGAQAYSRNVGDFGNGRVEIDWAYGDYRFRDWLGVRAGKVKTALGLFNDTQDMEFLHTWALLPQSLYPLDQRGFTIAHVGGDVYGEIPVKALGSFSYTAHIGSRPDDPRGGFQYSSSDSGTPLKTPISGMTTGADLRWTTRIPGLMVGASLLHSTKEGVFAARVGPRVIDLAFRAKKDEISTFYGEYTFGNLRLIAEYRRSWIVYGYEGGRIPDTQADQRGWYTAGSYRLHKRLEVGTYHSRYIPNAQSPTNRANNHLDDQAVTARVDLNKFWNVKVEGHFMDGNGSPRAARGFYLRGNPGGFDPRTNMLLVRTGLNF